MAKNLLIVESPTKVKTIKKFLGKDFAVEASMGHVRDLPRKDLGVNVEADFAPTYETPDSSKKVVKRLKDAAEEAENIYLGPDPDREGEAICWHLAELLKKKDKKLFRVMFNSITKDAVTQAIANPSVIDDDRVNAQQARRILDRLVGYQISPLLWRTIRGARSAGRVQSVAVRLIVEREKEIEAFKTVEFWTIAANLQSSKKETIQAALYSIDGKRLQVEEAPEDGEKPADEGVAEEEKATTSIRTEAEAKALISRLERAKYSVASVRQRPRKRRPYAPYTTSTLQQDASRRLGFNSDRTMRIAQSLYEGVDIGDETVGLITYMRTDSTRIVPEALDAAREFIGSHYGAKYVPKTPREYKSKKSAQDAHEAVRPTDVNRLPAQVAKKMSDEQRKLYSLIWERFVACQMEDARYLGTTVDIDADNCIFRLTGSILEFDGFTRVYADRDEDRLVPELKEGEALALLGLEPDQHFTKPPARYNDASLVKTLEERGIGRPSTYASIIKTIVDRNYVERLDRRFVPTALGRLTIELLIEHFPKVMDVGFTAHIEEELDEIEEGRREWHSTLHEFYTPFRESLELAKTGLKKSLKEREEVTEEKCPDCGKFLIKKWGRNGFFLSCPGYPECKYAKPLGEEEAPEYSEEKCELCSAQMIVKKGPNGGGRYLACSAYPKCKSTRPISTGVSCPKCGKGDLVERQSKRYRKTFWSCNKYPECDYASWYQPVAQHCPQCESPFLTLRHYKAGDVIVCPEKKCGYKAPVAEPAKA